MKEELVLGVRFTALPNRTCAYFCSQVSSELATDDPLANKFDVVWVPIYLFEEHTDSEGVYLFTELLAESV